LHAHRNLLEEVLRRPFESAQGTSEQFQRLMADHGVVFSMSRSGNVWDNAAMESFFSSLKTERTARKHVWCLQSSNN
jgi:putative transposase